LDFLEIFFRIILENSTNKFWS